MTDTKLENIEIKEEDLNRVNGGTDAIEPKFKFKVGEIVFFAENGQAEIVERRAEMIMGGKGYGCFYDIKTLKTSTFIPNVEEGLLKKVLK